MIEVRPGHERGHADHGWLDTYHSFSFADYYDPAHMGFGALRVINEDRVAPGAGFPMHSHRDMEIITYVLDGALEHRDSMGNHSVIRAGDVQRMSAGTGVHHSEYNASRDAPTHFLQIWILPQRAGLPPSYAQTHLEPESMTNRLRLVAGPHGDDGALMLHQDARLYALRLQGQSVNTTLSPGRRAYVQMARGEARVNGILLRAGDGARVYDETVLEFNGDGAELLLFDLA